MTPGSSASHSLWTRDCKPAPRELRVVVALQSQSAQPRRTQWWDLEWKEIDGTASTNSKMAWEKKGLRGVVMFCLGCICLPPRGYRTGTNGSHLQRQNTRIHSGASLSSFPFLLPKMANVNKFSVHMCFGIWMETLVCAPPPDLLAPSLAGFAKWTFLAQLQLNPELLCWYFPLGLITSQRSRL